MEWILHHPKSLKKQTLYTCKTEDGEYVLRPFKGNYEACFYSKHNGWIPLGGPTTLAKAKSLCKDHHLGVKSL